MLKRERRSGTMNYSKFKLEKEDMAYTRLIESERRSSYIRAMDKAARFFHVTRTSFRRTLAGGDMELEDEDTTDEEPEVDSE
jgi:RNA-splicing ligase RtcB